MSVVSDVTMTDGFEDDSDAHGAPPPPAPSSFTQRNSSLSSVLEYSDSDDVNTPQSHIRNQLSRPSTRVVNFAVESSDDEEKQRKHKHPRKKPETWMTQLAYSFRSTQRLTSKDRLESNDNVEYPHYASLEQPLRGTRSRAAQDEASPLIQKEQAKVKSDPVAIAAAFLQDYEANRPPSLPSDLPDISDHQLALFHLKFSGFFYPFILGLATFGLFVSSALEGFDQTQHQRLALTLLNVFAVATLCFDMWIRRELSDHPHHYYQQPHVTTRTTRSAKLALPLILFCLVLVLENVSRYFVTDDSIVLFASIFKPLALFYVSSQARDALEALRRIIRIVTRVLIMEMLLILMFAAIGCRLFPSHESFQDLSTSWLSLFKLSTTVVNPSIWMPMYEETQFSAIFFVFFIVISVFYLHSLVLSVVFQTYIQAATEVHERSTADREDAVQLSFLALQREGNDLVRIKDVRRVLHMLRPHYNAMKINALVEIVDPSDQKVVDYATFRTKIRQALNASIRTARNASTLAMSIELIAVFVAIVNFIYVILVSSAFDKQWFNATQEIVGGTITLIAAFELLIRFNPLRVPDFTPLTRLNATFDGLALLGATVSCSGLVLYFVQYPRAIDFILMGRAIDMIRVMRFFQIFRDVVRRSSDVFPVLAGPAVLVLTTLHTFVYVGMVLWGGAVKVGTHEGQITELYDLNNFNSYREGLVTMFQVCVVNDWHAIAEVFLYATRCASPYIVYPFFVLGNLIGVSIMLNVVTAFFVESFVTKLDESHEGPLEVTAKVHKERDFNILTSESTRSVKRMPSASEFNEDRGADADSEESSISEFYEFDVFEREGFDKIMQTVAGASNEDLARNLCHYLEVFEKMTPGRETVGYLVCDQHSLERFGNRRFQAKSLGFLAENDLHVVVSDMNAELLALSARPSFEMDRSLARLFPHPNNPKRILEVSASLLRRHPALSLFVSRVKEEG